MLRDILTKNLTYDFHLIYVNSFEDDVIYANELRQLTKEFPNFKLTEFVTRPSDLYQGTRGRLSLEQFAKSTWGKSTTNVLYLWTNAI
jgi:ferredoxin-NADP reductase